MISWRDIQIEDKVSVNEIKGSYCAGACDGADGRDDRVGVLCNADYSFTNMFIWRHEYKTMVSFQDEMLIVGNPHWLMYSYPLGDVDVRKAVEFLREDAHAKGRKLVIRGLTEESLDKFLDVYGEEFDISEDRDNADYIYTADKLCNLPGRKLSTKRNHINKFERNGDWEFVKITKDNIETAKDFVAEFYLEKGDPELESEAIAIGEMFEHYDALGFIGGLLYQSGEPIAFSAGTRLCRNCMDVHFEKALPHVEGAYTMVNREFARMVVAEYPEIEYFNREEDMGLEGLRKAKLSYHPDILLMKYFAREK